MTAAAYTLPAKQPRPASSQPASMRFEVLYRGESMGERRKEKSASKREQRQVYLSVAERKQIQDRKAGLKEKDHPERTIVYLGNRLSTCTLFTRLSKHLTHPIQRLDEGINFFL